MNPEKKKAREENARRIYHMMTAVHVMAGTGLAAAHVLSGNMYLAVQSLGTIAALWLIFKVLKGLNIKPVYSLYAVMTGFVFAAYTLGVACSLYKTAPGYDKMLHTMSGTFTMMLALPLFYSVKEGHRIESRDCGLAVVFCIAVSLAVAGIWEIAEYALSLVSGIDPQCVMKTGVADTMRDMIVCTAGALAAIPSLIRFYRTGDGGFLFAHVPVFVDKNFPAEEILPVGYQGDEHEGDSIV